MDCHGIKGITQYDNHLKVREATHHYFTCSMHRVTKDANLNASEIDLFYVMSAMEPVTLLKYNRNFFIHKSCVGILQY